LVSLFSVCKQCCELVCGEQCRGCLKP
jgi:hypothetical protein